eukprot:2388860-Rhodomonas_salina.2
MSTQQITAKSHPQNTRSSRHGTPGGRVGEHTWCGRSQPRCRLQQGLARWATSSPHCSAATPGRPSASPSQAPRLGSGGNSRRTARSRWLGPASVDRKAGRGFEKHLKPSARRPEVERARRREVRVADA